jgi:hypothetical protein
LVIGELNLKKANRVTVDQGDVGSNVCIYISSAIVVQLPIKTEGGTAQTHSMLLMFIKISADAMDKSMLYT